MRVLDNAFFVFTVIPVIVMPVGTLRASLRCVYLRCASVLGARVECLCRQAPQNVLVDRITVTAAPVLWSLSGCFLYFPEWMPPWLSFAICG